MSSLSIKPLEVYKSRDYLLVYSFPQDVVDCTVADRELFDSICLDPGGVVITAAVDASVATVVRKDGTRLAIECCNYLYFSDVSLISSSSASVSK